MADQIRFLLGKPGIKHQEQMPGNLDERGIDPQILESGADQD